MILSKRTLQKLRDLINEETEYRSGPKIIQFFNEFGFNDEYGQGFPSRWMFTDQKLEQINGTPNLDECIRKVLAPVNFIGHFQDLDQHINEFNQYLAFDKWKIVRDQAELKFQKLAKIEINEEHHNGNDENEFLNREFSDVNVSRLNLEGAISEVLEHRIDEIEKCFTGHSPLAVILLAGSTLEGILLGLATQYPKKFNTVNCSPKDGQTGKVKMFQYWTLSNLIDAAKEMGLIQYDTHKFSHSLRDFRNYIHPYEQMASGFQPREHTAKICLQVLKAAITELSENIKKIST
jgi:hypothetical protein